LAYAVQAWFDAFVFTQAVEVPVYVLALRQAPRERRERGPKSLEWQVLLAFGASAVTHPIVWFVIPDIGPSSYLEYALEAEGFAVMVETFYFFSLHVASFRRSLAWSLLANGLSLGLGFASRALFGWP